MNMLMNWQIIFELCNFVLTLSFVGWTFMSSDEKNGKTPETLFLWMLESKSSGDSDMEKKNNKSD